MLQIKTVYTQGTNDFDEEVNKALKDGWLLTRRDFDEHGFIGMLEKETFTEAERTCENCKHRDLHPVAEPCFSCSMTCSEREADV